MNSSRGRCYWHQYRDIYTPTRGEVGTRKWTTKHYFCCQGALFKQSYEVSLYLILNDPSQSLFHVAACHHVTLFTYFPLRPRTSVDPARQTSNFPPDKQSILFIASSSSPPSLQLIL